VTLNACEAKPELSFSGYHDPGGDQSGAREIVLIQNFLEELKRLAPAR
jgi:hypothetical protein